MIQIRLWERQLKRFAIVDLSTLVILLPLDFLFLGAIGKKLFADNAATSS